MSERYKIRDSRQLYFVSFATVNWIDVFTRRLYNDIFVDSLRYCQQHKGLEVYAWCLMTNHDYLHRNPVVAGFVDSPEDFQYSSARNYASRPGLLDILFVD